MTHRLSVVVPAYREAGHLRENLAEIRSVVEPLGDIEFVVVDDGSPDDTWAILVDLAKTWPALKALRFSRNFGKEAALCAGLSQATGDAVIVIDADLQHPPDMIPEMVRLWADDGYEVVNGIKRTREPESALKRWLTRRYHSLFSMLAGMDVGNASDFKLLDRRVVDSLNALPERGRFFRGLVAWMGFRQIDLPFDVRPRQQGQSNWSLLRLARLAINSILSFSTIPMHLITALGAVLGVIAAVLGVQTLQLWLSGQAAPGFTTVILLLLIIGSALMIGLGIIGAYIAKIYAEVKGRPQFFIQGRLVGRASDRNEKDQTDRMIEVDRIGV